MFFYIGRIAIAAFFICVPWEAPQERREFLVAFTIRLYKDAFSGIVFWAW